MSGRGADEPLQDETASVLALTWIVHLAIFCFLLLARIYGTGTSKIGLPLVSESLLHWDTNIYLHIATEGYDVDWHMVFFPFYPFLIQIFTFFVRDALIAALTVAFLCHLGASVFLYRLAREDLSPEDGKFAVLFSLVFPTAFYAVIPYTESVFLFLVVAGFYYLRHEKFLLAGLLGFFAVLTRPTGVAVIAMYYAEYWFHLRRHVSLRAAAFALVFPLCGVGAILLLNHLYRGDMFYFMHKVNENWGKHLTWPQDGFRKVKRIFFRPKGLSSVTLGFNEMLGATLIWIATVYSALKLRRGYFFFCLVSAVLATFQNFWQSTLRYSFAVFPLYFLLARAASRSEILRYLLITGSVMYLAILSFHFAQGHWVQ